MQTTPATPNLFAWDRLEDNPSLQTIRQLLEAIPDGALLEQLRAKRGRGRNDYSVTVLWGCLLLSVICRHVTMEACLAELCRNQGLRELIGIEGEEAVPKPWNMSRFLKRLGQEPFLSMTVKVFDDMTSWLAQDVENLGCHVAGDSTYLSARLDRSKANTATPTTLPGPEQGCKKYTDDAGKVTKTVEWFGYKLHLLVDVRHEVAVAYHVSAANEADCTFIPGLVEQAKASLGEERIRTLAYDKAADHATVHQALGKAQVKPVIENRQLWKTEPLRELPGHENGPSPVVYDESGTIFCQDGRGRDAKTRPMVYVGHEKQRRTLKYRCPACHYNWNCANDRACNMGKVYGRTVRVRQEIDLRRFPPVPRATKTFERLYRGRTSVERVNARFKVFWGTDDGNISGAERFHARVNAVMLVHMAFATILAAAPKRKGSLGKLRLGAVQKARQSCLDEPSCVQ